MLQSIRNSGEPVTEEEWNEHFSAKSGMTEASALWQHAITSGAVALTKADQTKLDLDAILDERLQIPNYAERPEELKALAEYIASIESDLVAIHAAVDANELVFYPYDFLDPDRGENEIWGTHQAGGLMALETLVRLHQGDLDGATDSLVATLGCAKAMDGNPGAANYIMRYATEAMFYRCAAELLQDENLSNEALRRLQNEVRSIDHRENLKWGIIGERISGLASLETVRTNYPPGIRLGATPRAKMRCIESTTQSIAAIELPWHEGLIEVDRIEGKMRASQSFLDGWLPSSVFPHSMEFYFAADGVALAHSLDVLLAAELFRRENGQLPKTLEEMEPDYLPEVPQDPYDGKPLRFVAEEGGAVAYSVGRNRSDEDGTFPYSQKLGVRPDLGFELKRPSGAEQTSSPAQ